MTGYPTPEALRQHVMTARADAYGYLAKGDTVKADQRNDDADWYEELIYREEWRLAHNQPRKEWAEKKDSQRVLAKKFGVSQHTIWAIIHNKLWVKK